MNDPINVMKFIATLVVIAITLVPVVIAFKRSHKSRWIITALAVIPCYGITWFIALVWSLWPKESTL